MPNTLTSDGKVTVPQAVLKHLGIASGDPVEFHVTETGAVVLEKHVSHGRNHGKFDAMVGKYKKDLTTDDVMLLLRGEPNETRL